MLLLISDTKVVALVVLSLIGWVGAVVVVLLMLAHTTHPSDEDIYEEAAREICTCEEPEPSTDYLGGYPPCLKCKKKVLNLNLYKKRLQ